MTQRINSLQPEVACMQQILDLFRAFPTHHAEKTYLLGRQPCTACCPSCCMPRFYQLEDKRDFTLRLQVSEIRIDPPKSLRLLRVKYVLDKKDSGISTHCMMNMLDIETASARMHAACLRMQFIVSKPAYSFLNYILIYCSACG